MLGSHWLLFLISPLLIKSYASAEHDQTTPARDCSSYQTKLHEKDVWGEKEGRKPSFLAHTFSWQLIRTASTVNDEKLSLNTLFRFQNLQSQMLFKMILQEAKKKKKSIYLAIQKPLHVNKSSCLSKNNS